VEKLVEKYGFVFSFAHINKRFLCTRYSTRSYDIIMFLLCSYTFEIFCSHVLIPSRSCDLGRFIIARARLFVKGATYFFT
jgi:hypothetical protein